MREIVISEERIIDEFIEELVKKIDSANNDIKISKLKKALLDLKSRKVELEGFKNVISQEVSSSNQTRVIRNLFKRINIILSCGFDYYYFSPIVEKIVSGESLENEKVSIDVLLNENQLEKLNKTINCTASLKLINYRIDDEERNAIWFKNTPVTINLISFSRTEDNGIIIKQSNHDDIFLTEEQLTNFLSDKNGEYEGLEYKTVSKSGLQVKKLRK